MVPPNLSSYEKGQKAGDGLVVSVHAEVQIANGHVMYFHTEPHEGKDEEFLKLAGQGYQVTSAVRRFK